MARFDLSMNYSTKFYHQLPLLGTIALTVGLGWLYQHASDTLCYSKLAFVYGGNLSFWMVAALPVKEAYARQMDKRGIRFSLLVVGLSTLTLNQLTVYLIVEGLFSLLYTCDANISLSDWMLTNGILSNLFSFAIIIGAFGNTFRLKPPVTIRENQPSTIQIKQNGSIHLIDLMDIVKLEADNNSVNIHTNQKRFVQYGRLKDWEEKLEDQGFIRIHRSYVVNPSFIQSYQAKPSGDGTLTLTNGEKLRVSRNFRSNLYGDGHLRLS